MIGLIEAKDEKSAIKKVKDCLGPWSEDERSEHHIKIVPINSMITISRESALKED
jgi:hypothetical protein